MLLLVSADENLYQALLRTRIKFRCRDTTEEAIAFLDANQRDRATYLVAYGLDVIRDPHQRGVPDITDPIVLRLPIETGRDLTDVDLAGMLRVGARVAESLPRAAESLLERIRRQARTGSRRGELVDA